MGPRAVWTGTEISSLAGFDPRTARPVPESLYRLRYPVQLKRIRRSLFPYILCGAYGAQYVVQCLTLSLIYEQNARFDAYLRHCPCGTTLAVDVLSLGVLLLLSSFKP